MRIWPAILAVALGSAMLVACGGSGSDDDPPANPGNGGDEPTPSASPATAPVNPGDLGVLEPNRPEVGKPAPDFALIDARDGTVRKLSDYRGTPVVLNWYASWCEPCKRELPLFRDVDAELRDAVQFIGIDFKEDAGKALKILDDNGVDYPALLDSKGDVGDHYRLPGPPLTYFIDAEGLVRAIKVGEIKSAELSANLAKVNVEWADR